MKQLMFLVIAVFLNLSHAQSETPAEAGTVIASESRQILVLLRQIPSHYRGNDGYEAGYGDARSKASREFIGNRLATAYGLRFVGFWPMPEIGLDCLIMEVPEGQAVSDFVAIIERDNEVEWAEPVETYRSLGKISYNDPLFAASPAATQWHLAELHKTSTGRGVTVAIIDSSIDETHPDLAGQVQLNRNFVVGRALGAENHGTGVAGIIAAKANNEQGMVGVAPRARLLGLRACWQSGGGSICDSLSLAKALHFAVEKDVNVLNISLTGPSGKLFARLIDKAIANGSVVVAAVDPGEPGGGFPASYKGVVAVADSATAAASFGAYRAPGRLVPTTQPNSKWYTVNGSSYSAAHVSGLFALLIEQRGSNADQPVLVELDGSGAIDARASLTKATGG